MPNPNSPEYRHAYPTIPNPARHGEETAVPEQCVNCGAALQKVTAICVNCMIGRYREKNPSLKNYPRGK